VLLTVSITTKSAQLFFHLWLVEAMEGPTPVSALLHAANMVTAGIYLYLRLFPIMFFFSYTPLFLLVIGSITALTAAVAACF